MILDKKKTEEEIGILESQMSEASFWENKEDAGIKVKRLQELKAELNKLKAIDDGNAVLTIFSGAGGDDAEDFSRMLLEMYFAYAKRNKYTLTILHENKNDHGGFRNITVEVSGKKAYRNLKNESGVHRLVRISPFNAKKLRHTSFSLVEVIPILSKSEMGEIKDSELKIEFSKAGGPGGQNVNKRETAVRITHIPTNISVHVATERSQESNRDKALELLLGKIHRYNEATENKKTEALYISKTTDIEWGNQIRSYVLHPYKLVKDHRTNIETSDVDAVLNDGHIDEFIEAELDL